MYAQAVHARSSAHCELPNSAATPGPSTSPYASREELTRRELLHVNQQLADVEQRLLRNSSIQLHLAQDGASPLSSYDEAHLRRQQAMLADKCAVLQRQLQHLVQPVEESFHPSSLPAAPCAQNTQDFLSPDVPAHKVSVPSSAPAALSLLNANDAEAWKRRAHLKAKLQHQFGTQMTGLDERFRHHLLHHMLHVGGFGHSASLALLSTKQLKDLVIKDFVAHSDDVNRPSSTDAHLMFPYHNANDTRRLGSDRDLSLGETAVAANSSPPSLGNLTAPPAAACSSASIDSDGRPVTAISVPQPFADAIMQRATSSLTRNWESRVPEGGVWWALHASGTSATKGTPEVRALHTSWSAMPQNFNQLPRRCVLGFVHISHVSAASVDSRASAAASLYTYCIDNTFALDTPIHVSGRSRLWQWNCPASVTLPPALEAELFACAPAPASTQGVSASATAPAPGQPSASAARAYTFSIGDHVRYRGDGRVLFGTVVHIDHSVEPQGEDQCLTVRLHDGDAERDRSTFSSRLELVPANAAPTPSPHLRTTATTTTCNTGSDVAAPNLAPPSRTAPSSRSSNTTPLPYLPSNADSQDAAPSTSPHLDLRTSASLLDSNPALEWGWGTAHLSSHLISPVRSLPFPGVKKNSFAYFLVTHTDGNSVFPLDCVDTVQVEAKVAEAVKQKHIGEVEHVVARFAADSLPASWNAAHVEICTRGEPSSCTLSYRPATNRQSIGAVHHRAACFEANLALSEFNLHWCDLLAFDAHTGLLYKPSPAVLEAHPGERVPVQAPLVTNPDRSSIHPHVTCAATTTAAAPDATPSALAAAEASPSALTAIDAESCSTCQQTPTAATSAPCRITPGSNQTRQPDADVSVSCRREPKVKDVAVRSAEDIILGDRCRDRLRTNPGFPVGPHAVARGELRAIIARYTTSPTLGEGVFGVHVHSPSAHVAEGSRKRGTTVLVECTHHGRTSQNSSSSSACPWKMRFELTHEGWVLASHKCNEHRGHELQLSVTEAMSSRATRQGIPLELHDIALELQHDARPVAQIYEVLQSACHRRGWDPDALFTKEDVRSSYTPSREFLRYDTTNFVDFLHTRVRTCPKLCPTCLLNPLLLVACYKTMCFHGQHTRCARSKSNKASCTALTRIQKVKSHVSSLRWTMPWRSGPGARTMCCSSTLSSARTVWV